MTVARIGELVLPAEAGAVVERSEGDPRFAVLLVEAQAGHPPASERQVCNALEALHAARPVGRLFITFDASGKSGSYEGEVDVTPYRAYSNPEITRGITLGLIDQDLASAGMAFAIICDPPTRLEAVDDWYGWAVQHDVLDELNTEAAKIVLAAQLARLIIPPGTPRGDRAERLLALVHLNLTAAEWRTDSADLAAIDPADALADLQAMMPEFTAMAAAFTRYQALAIRFYEAGVSRAEYLAREASGRLRRTGATTGAAVVARPWADAAAEWLRREQISFARIRPAGVSMASMLDEASVNVGELSDSTRRLTEMFSGERIRGRIEALSTKEREDRKRRAGEWLMAARALSVKDEVAQADECFDRALELNPDATAFRAAGGHAADHGRHRQAVEHFERALQLDPRDAHAWEGYGVALDGVGRREPARKALLTSVYLKPGEGRFWNRLGLHYHGRGQGATACYCFRKGKALNDSASIDNYGTVCSSADTQFARPLVLHPLVIAFMHYVGRPVQHVLGRSLPS
jgi:tetratricopeptide (TPR) repeat protein